MQCTRHAKADEANAVTGYSGCDKTTQLWLLYGSWRMLSRSLSDDTQWLPFRQTSPSWRLHEPSFQTSVQSSETVSFLETPVPDSRVVRIGLLCFLAGYHKRRLNQGSVVLFVSATAHFIFVFFMFQVHMLFCFLVLFLFILFQLSLPVQSTVWKDLFPKWPTMSGAGLTYVTPANSNLSSDMQDASHLNVPADMLYSLHQTYFPVLH